MNTPQSSSNPESVFPGLPATTDILGFAAGPLDTNCYVLIDRSSPDANSGDSSSNSAEGVKEGVTAGVAAGQPAGQAVVIDPGMGAKAVIDELADEYNFTVDSVVLTHGHIDHIRDAGALGVPVYVHPLDRFFLEESLEGSPFSELFDVANMVQPEDIRDLEDTVEIGGVTFDVHHTPGHSPGHVMLRVGGLIIGGDVLFRGGVGRTDLPGCSPEDMLLTLKKITAEFADDDVVLPGHGPQTTMGTEKRTNSFLHAVQ